MKYIGKPRPLNDSDIDKLTLFLVDDHGGFANENQAMHYEMSIRNSILNAEIAIAVDTAWGTYISIVEFNPEEMSNGEFMCKHSYEYLLKNDGEVYCNDFDIIGDMLLVTLKSFLDD